MDLIWKDLIDTSQIRNFKAHAYFRKRCVYNIKWTENFNNYREMSSEQNFEILVN